MSIATAPAAGFRDLYTPKLVTVLREGYGLPALRADAIAGLTVAIVALPLSMAIAIASGVSPDRGLTAAIIGGLVISALGGSRFQIGGPAGAFIVLVAATVSAHGVEGLLLATFLSGLMLAAAGFLRLGTFIKYIPYPVTVGFTAGIAAIILVSQVRDLFGLTLPGGEPGPLLEKLPVLAGALPSINPAAVALAVLTIGIVVAMRRWRPHWPAYLVAIVAASLGGTLLALPVDTIGSRFGGIPGGLPMPSLPSFDTGLLIAVLPSAVAFTLLGGIESLLSAVVADSMTGRRHRSNVELVAQGLANIASSLFGGICVTGTIARTATNVRAGARGPVAGILHAVFLLLFLLVGSSLASYVPLAALAGVLVVVAWNMAERHQFATLLRASVGDAVVLLVTFLLVIFRDLAEGILIGFALSAMLFIHRMAQAVAVESGALLDPDLADREPEDGEPAAPDDVVVCRISGAFFFGAAANVSAALDRLGERPRAWVLDFSGVPVFDSTAAATIAGFARQAARQGARVWIAAAGDGVRKLLEAHGAKAPLVAFSPTTAAALAAAESDRGSIGGSQDRAAQAPNSA